MVQCSGDTVSRCFLGVPSGRTTTPFPIRESRQDKKTEWKRKRRPLLVVRSTRKRQWNIKDPEGDVRSEESSSKRERKVADVGVWSLDQKDAIFGDWEVGR